MNKILSSVLHLTTPTRICALWSTRALRTSLVVSTKWVKSDFQRTLRISREQPLFTSVRYIKTFLQIVRTTDSLDALGLKTGCRSYVCSALQFRLVVFLGAPLLFPFFSFFRRPSWHLCSPLTLSISLRLLLSLFLTFYE